MLAPNRYVRDQIKSAYLARINELLGETEIPERPLVVEIAIDHPEGPASQPLRANGTGRVKKKKSQGEMTRRLEKTRTGSQVLNQGFTFENFVEGKSNELAKAAAMQAVHRSSQSPNPLLLYGAAGLGKTHLIQALGNQLLQASPDAKLIYVRSQGFVQDMADACRMAKGTTMHEFVEFYRSADVLLIDDIQFFAKKNRSQEEFFHLFNSLHDSGGQMVFTSDRYPSEIEGLELRLQSRFVWGLSLEVEIPGLETRVAILLEKARAERLPLDPEVAFFIAERIRSNVRELEGALQRLIANARFTATRITSELAKRALGDMFANQPRRIGIDEIKRTVAEYYKIRISDLHSPRRSRNIARPRQMAMFLSKQLTSHSLPEIGEAFGGRDHTTVLYACRKIRDLINENTGGLAEDNHNLNRLLTAS